MAFAAPDRLPVVEWAPWWDQTLQRWRAEGLDVAPGPDEQRYAICNHFGLDDWRQDWIDSRTPSTPRPETRADGLVEDAAAYDRVRPTLYGPVDEQRRSRWVRWASRHERGACVVWMTFHGLFWWPRELLGVERHLYAFYDQADLLHRIIADQVEHILRCLEEAAAILRPDFISLAEDMSYNQGPMLSESMFVEFLAPHYRRIAQWLHERDILLMVDSDGMVTDMIPWLQDAGADGCFPLERRSGVDVAAIRRAHPRWRMLGGFDKTVMHQGEQAIRSEFERLAPVARSGGFIVSCDHQTPPEVSLSDYRRYVQAFNEYAGKVWS
jgi:hypothetical protein